MSELNYSIDESNIPKDETALIKFNGVINPATIEQFETAMTEVIKLATENQCSKLSVSFKELTYINSSGLRIVLTSTKEANKNKISVKFIELDEEVYKIFEQVGYCRIFDITKM